VPEGIKDDHDVSPDDFPCCLEEAASEIVGPWSFVRRERSDYSQNLTFSERLTQVPQINVWQIKEIQIERAHPVC
jgi:hypothetical protein